MRSSQLLAGLLLATAAVAVDGSAARANPVPRPYVAYAPYFVAPVGVVPAYGYVGPFAPYAYGAPYAPYGYVAPYAPYGVVPAYGYYTPYAPFGYVAPLAYAPPPAPVAPATATAKITFTLPDDAVLTFNGTAAAGSGKTRTYETPQLVKGQPYVYEVTAVVIRDRQEVKSTERVVVWGGEESKVTFQLPAVIPPKKKQ